jgi:arginyl-tRNA synthetase
MTLIQQLNLWMRDAFSQAGVDPSYGAVLPSQRPELGQFQCNGALGAAKAAKANPKAIAEKVLAVLQAQPALRGLSLAGPGFINLSVDDAYLAAQLQANGLGLEKPAQPQKVIVDFGGPNVAKPMHVGHLRSSILGDCLQRLQRRLGHDVVSDVHLGDWGTQMGMLIEGVREEQPGLPYFTGSAGPFPAESPVSLEDLERLYPVMSARCKEDETLAEKARIAVRDLQAGHAGYLALWKHFVGTSITALKEDFGQLGIHFDLWYGESRYQPAIPGMVKDLMDRGLAVVSEGATVLPIDPINGREIPPLLLLKSDGGALYGTTDLATLRERVKDDRAERILYVTDKRQSLHFTQVFAAAQKSGYAGACRLDHVDFGTVNGKDGKPFKTRAGGVMRLRDLLQMAMDEAAKAMEAGGVGAEFGAEEKADIARKVGLAAVKFADLSNHRTHDYVFDLEKFSQFEGKTGPYHLYAAVRMKAILRKAAERGFKPGPLAPAVGDSDRQLMLVLAGLPEAYAGVAEHNTPHALCEYAYQLAQAFSGFYQNNHILNETDEARRAAWLGLTQLTLTALLDVLDVLGMPTPERM